MRGNDDSFAELELGFFPPLLFQVDKIMGLMCFVGSTSVATSVSVKVLVAMPVLAVAICLS